MKKQDALNKLCALSAVMDSLPEDVTIISSTIDDDCADVHLYNPDEERISEIFASDVAEVPFGARTKRFVRNCGVEIFWLVDKEEKT